MLRFAGSVLSRIHIPRIRHFHPGRSVPVIAILLFLLLLPQAGRAQEPDLTSPRESFRTFLVNMVVYSSDTTESVKEHALRNAVRTLDLSDVPVSLREEQGVRIARDLKNFLDRFELVDVDELPEHFDGPVYVWRKPAANTEIALARDEDSLWLFSRKTVASLPALLDLVRDHDVVEGVEQTVRPDNLADWLRLRMPESLLQKAVYFENWQWIALVIIILLGILVERIVISFLSKWIIRFVQQSKARTEFKLNTQLIKPLGIFCMALLWSLLLPSLDLALQAETVLYFATQFVIAASGVWAAYRMVDLAASYFEVLAARTESKFDDLLVPMIRRALKIIVIAFGLLFIADNLNIDITSLLAGLGIGGVAFALAAKDTVENLFGSLTVMFDKPFEIGDWIRIGDVDGTVEEVGFRSSRIRTFYNSQITMPNSRLVSAAVDNMGRRRYRRLSATLGVQYDTPPEKIEAFCEGIREIIRQHPYTRKDFYMAYFNEFADFSLNILLYVFHETPDWATELRERHRLLLDIVRLAKRLGVEFAFPTQTLHMSSMPQPVHYTTDPVPEKPEVKAINDAITFGRSEAEALLREQWQGGIQPPVSFDDPTSMKPGNGPPQDVTT
ncbi:mechanosensitive ion channel family protein [bacterium]|nr:mechanosensitive ion channel family protein [bacterium]